MYSHFASIRLFQLINLSFSLRRISHYMCLAVPLDSFIIDSQYIFH